MRSSRVRIWTLPSKPAKSFITTRPNCSRTAIAGSGKSPRIWSWTPLTASQFILSPNALCRARRSIGAHTSEPHASMLQGIAFYVFSAVMIASALMVIAARNPVHSVLFLILAFFNAAALFVLLGAEFLAMILVVVYVGAVAVLFLFVVMMLDIDFVALRRGFMEYLPLGALIGLVLMSELLIVLGASVFGNSVPAAHLNPSGLSNTRMLGD